MTKPVTNVEIEDVLSSIRRLVSSSDRVERAARPPSENASEKLVLTPSLRVDDGDNALESLKSDEEEEVGEETSDETLAVEETSGDGGFKPDLDSEEEFLEFIKESAASDVVDDAEEDAVDESDFADEFDDSDALDGLDQILEKNNENSPEIEVIDDAGDAAGEVETVFLKTQVDLYDTAATDAAMSDLLRRRAAEFETIIAEKDDQWDPDGTTQDDNAAISGGPVPWQDQDEPEISDEGNDDSEKLTDPLSVFDDVPTAADIAAEAEVQSVQDAAEEDSGEPLVLADAEVLAETAELSIGNDAAESDALPYDDDGDVDGDEKDIDDAEPIELETAAFTFKSRARETLSDTPELVARHEAETANTDAPMAIEEALLDEEALRDLVSEIVRQELQGALGERITRNVRKLVRREIHRALASQQLE